MRRDRLHEKRPAVATIAKQPEPEIEAQPASRRPHSALPNGQPYAFGTWTPHNVTMSLSPANAISGAGVRATFYAVDNAQCFSANSAGCVTYRGPFMIPTSGRTTVTFFSENPKGVPK